MQCCFEHERRSPSEEPPPLHISERDKDERSGHRAGALICSFWLVSGLAIVGEWARARDLVERLLRIASPLGLFAEEGKTGRHRCAG
jgi:GH15 family glucan-1,4-alpha-glucosidase